MAQTLKIAIDSDDLPAATRLSGWRGMLCDTYMGMDCAFPGDGFRSVIEGFAIADHSLTRVTSSQHFVKRSPTLIKRDGLELIIFGVLLAGRVTTIQGGREVVFEPGTIVVSDTSRPFETYVEKPADVVWVSVPKKPIAERVRGIEDLVALSIRPAKPVAEMAVGLMAGLDEALSRDLPAPDADRLTANVLDLLAMTITSSGLPPAGRRRPAASTPVQ